MQGSIDFTGLLSGDIIGEGGTSVIANPSGSATDTLNKVQIDETIYSVEGGGGTEVIANPTGTATDELQTVEIDDVIYSISGEQQQADWTQTDTSAVDYIKHKPTIPPAQVNSDWNSSSGVSEILNKPTLSTVATSGSYNDLSNTPTIPDSADDISFNNTGTGMVATDVQDAITELKSNLTQLNGLNVVKRITTPATVVSFSDGSNLPMYKLLLSIEPVQEGSGDPSPENIRPISGFTEANVVVSPTTDAEDGTTYNVEFKDGSNPLTVYGGTLDVVSGELVVDRASVDLGTLNWGYASERVTFYTRSLSTVIFKPGDDKTAKTLCSAYRYVAYRDFSNNNTFSIGSPSGMLYIKDTHYTNATAFKTAMNGVQLVYELAAPITYQLTPTQVKSLLGTNNVWADTGDILEVDYTAILNFS